MTEGNTMACEEAVRLLEEEVVILNDISLKILNIKTFQAMFFIKEVGEVVRILEMKGTPNLPDQLREKILPLALPVGDFVQGPGLQMLRLNVEYVIPECNDYGDLRPDLPGKLLEQIGLIENKLEKYLDETDLYDVWEGLRNNLALLPFRKAVRDLLQASQELKEAINFFHPVVTESAVLSEYLYFLREWWQPWKYESSHELVEGISNVVNKGLDAVRCPDKDRLSSQMGTFEEDVLLVNDHFMLCSNPGRKLRVILHAEQGTVVLVVDDDAWLDSGLINIKENCIEKQARNFFDWKNGMRLVLLDTAGKLHSFKEEIDMIRKARGKH